MFLVLVYMLGLDVIVYVIYQEIGKETDVAIQAYLDHTIADILDGAKHFAKT